MGSQEVERLFGFHAVREALRARRRRFDRLLLKEGLHRHEVADLEALARTAGVPVAWPGTEELRRGLPAGARDQGIILEAGPVIPASLDDLLATPSGQRRLVALDGVEDPQNVGAILRVAEAAGCDGVLITERRAPPLSPAVARASAGALEHLAVARVTNLPRTLNHLKDKGFWVIGCDSGAGEDLFRVPTRVWQGDLVIVLGAEGKGVRRGVDRCVDHRLRIPLMGKIESLNVGAAAAVVLFEALRQTRGAESPGCPESE